MKIISKIEIRKKSREIRRKILPIHRHQAAQSAAQLFIGLPLFKQSNNIACYLALQDEFDASSIIEAIWQAKKVCYVPVLSTEQENTLNFVRYEYGDALHLNRYSILEPVNITRMMAPETLDLVITPVVAFDLQGHRLGTGGGYYDRTFAFLNAPLAYTEKKPYMMGLAYAAQQMDALPKESWDILLDGLMTETTVYSFRGQM